MTKTIEKQVIDLSEYNLQAVRVTEPYEHAFIQDPKGFHIIDYCLN